VVARRYTDEDVAQWYARYQEGLTLKEVAAEFGVAEPTVQGAFLRKRLPRRPAIRRWVALKPRPEVGPLPARRPRSVPEREWRVLRAREAGRSLAEIGRELGVSRQRVAQIEARGWSLLAARRRPASASAPPANGGKAAG
jgi:transcriptional regulator with XRE-family HTH domain